MNDILQIIFSGIVALSTVIYAILTWKLVNETRRSREFQITPDINIFLERGDASWKNIYLTIENQGFGTAKKVRFEIIRDFQHYRNKIFHLSEKGVIKNGINMFYPKQRFKYVFTNLSENFEEQILDFLVFRVSYQDINDKSYSKEFNLPLEELAGVGTISPPDNYIGRISYYLEKISKSLDKIEKREKT